MTKKYSAQSYNKLILSGLVASLCFISIGCDFVWNVLNRNALNKDIAELAAQYAVKISQPDCNMIDTTREGYCIFTAKENEIIALVNGLKLNKVQSWGSAADLAENEGVSRQYNSTFWYLEQSLKPFNIYKVNDKTKINTFFIGGRPEQLRLKNGSAFEYFLLYYDTSSSRACIFVCYSFG